MKRFLTDKASNNADTDMNASAKRQSHKGKPGPPFSNFMHFQLSFQNSSLHLAFKVLVRHWHQAFSELKMKFTTHFALHSQGMRLGECILPREGLHMTNRTLTCSVTFYEEFAPAPTLVLHRVITGHGWKEWDFHAEPFPNHPAVLWDCYFISFSSAFFHA